MMNDGEMCRISDVGRLRGGVASVALRRGTLALRVRSRTQRRHDRSDVTGHQRIGTGRREILPGETHQDRIPGLIGLTRFRFDFYFHHCFERKFKGPIVTWFVVLPYLDIPWDCCQFVWYYLVVSLI